ncbi:AmmeMemoRadiSam system protein A [Methylomonas sp. LL1]|uniref:AmmeMemoRadiSam system protein A n=1 Tax=Methylomonas sp. LL1 TaxID=2785785 RepID=UPI0018C44221|nr:AmmeMemoRadiSam system protein A [Methylomonas sp. LL1]QPK64948.1 AmmeMemoRadiSam system protein A [Methylomonas sp. LL1]
MSLNDSQKNQLLELAQASILHGLETGEPLPIDPQDYAAELTVNRATFVTLERRGQLRGCIGMLEAVRPLVRDIAENAFAAAFRDPRFPPLTIAELADLELHISILSPAEAVHFKSEQDLIEQLKPGIDGLILREGYRRGTFLPSVWEQLPDASQFLRHLKQKAGLPADYWSDSLEIFRYSTEMFSRSA